MATATNNTEETSAVKDKYLTIKSVTEMLNCTERHIYDLIVAKELTAIKIGGRAVRISERSLNDFIQRHTIDPEDFFDPDKEEKAETTPPAGRQVARSRWVGR